MGLQSNQHFIQKADLAIANLVSDGGYLPEEKAKEFWEIAIEESVVLGMATTITMTSHTWELSKLGFSGRVLRAAVEGQALVSGDRSKPDLGKATITTSECIAEVRIPYGVVEDNVNGQGFIPLVQSTLAKAVARDMEELVIQGDTASADPYLALFDGFLKLATSHVVNAGNVRLTKSVLKWMAQAMPAAYYKGPGSMAYITSKNALIDYDDSIASRATPEGDVAALNAPQSRYAGSKVQAVPMFPEDLSSYYTNVLMLDPKNMAVGMHRQVRLETDKDIQKREWILVVTVRFGCNFHHEPAVVKATNVLATAGA